MFFIISLMTKAFQNVRISKARYANAHFRLRSRRSHLHSIRTKMVKLLKFPESYLVVSYNLLQYYPEIHSFRRRKAHNMLLPEILLMIMIVFMNIIIYTQS